MPPTLELLTSVDDGPIGRAAEFLVALAGTYKDPG
jgi:hypothetical protein